MAERASFSGTLRLAEVRDRDRGDACLASAPVDAEQISRS